MRVFRHFLTLTQAAIPVLLLAALLYGFPSCCEDDSGTNTDGNTANCEYGFEEEGIIYQDHSENYHPWIFLVKKDTYDVLWTLTLPSVLPHWNLPTFYRKDSLHVRITGVEIPPSADEAIDFRPWPLLILHIEKID